MTVTDIANNLCVLLTFCSLTSISVKQITDVEKTFTLRFADDYHEYLLVFGIASSEGHEHTDIYNSKRLNVVDITLTERKITFSIPHDWYVLEETNIDGIVIWQSSTGEVYQTQPGRETLKIADSICGCLDLT